MCIRDRVSTQSTWESSLKKVPNSIPTPVLALPEEDHFEEMVDLFQDVRRIINCPALPNRSEEKKEEQTRSVLDFTDQLEEVASTRPTTRAILSNLRDTTSSHQSEPTLKGSGKLIFVSPQKHHRISIKSQQEETLKSEETPENRRSSKLEQEEYYSCLLYTSPSPRDLSTSRMPSSA
eukprot:TRINITY_DN38623_c0_g1_i1.p1 TRINITY_DN38623_c0_g1~~TRINITY_DN38623_c0_g1_i1.p1  ORF type:complete len:178 (+),score=42.01 TRINITY_DN38623_c0_g1_i1:167-700(+)